MKVYRFKVWLEIEKSIWRIIEVREDQTLDNFHDAIQETFEWDDDHLYSFFLSGKAWDRNTEYTSPRADGQSMFGGPKPKQAQKAVLSKLLLEPGKKFLYIFDFGDEWRHEIKLLDICDEDPDADYPRTTESRGGTLEQYPVWGDDDGHEEDRGQMLEALGPIAGFIPKLEEVLDEKAGSTGKGDLKRQHDLAMDLSSAIQAREGADVSDTYALIEETTGYHDLTGWLVQLPFDLEHAGFLDEALAMGKAWAEIVEPECFLGDRAYILARAGRRQEALDQAAENLRRFPDDVETMMKAGYVHEKLNELASAEAMYRKACAGAKEYPDKEWALDHLIPLLKNTGRDAEATALKKERYKPGTAVEMFPRATVVRDGPKVGRNDPCPCGSGKKFKKCCLGKERD